VGCSRSPGALWSRRRCGPCRYVSVFPSGQFPRRIGASPSGKAADFDSAIRRFESSRPSQTFPELETGCGLCAKARISRGFAEDIRRRDTRSPKSASLARHFRAGLRSSFSDVRDFAIAVGRDGSIRKETGSFVPRACATGAATHRRRRVN
jgi:hypothetical protein